MDSLYSAKRIMKDNISNYRKRRFEYQSLFLSLKNSGLKPRWFLFFSVSRKKFMEIYFRLYKQNFYEVYAGASSRALNRVTRKIYIFGMHFVCIWKTKVFQRELS